MKINVWHSIEQRTIFDASTYQWQTQLKTCAEGRHFKHMT